MKSKDRIGGILMVILGVAAVVMAQSITQAVNSNEPGPRLFPMIAGVGIAVCGLLVALQAKPEEEEPYLDKAGWKRLAISLAAMLVYYFALTNLGFLLSTPFFTYAIIAILAGKKKTNPAVTVVVALITTIALYLTFQKAFAIMLPAGTLLKAMGINLVF